MLINEKKQILLREKLINAILEKTDDGENKCGRQISQLTDVAKAIKSELIRYQEMKVEDMFSLEKGQLNYAISKDTESMTECQLNSQISEMFRRMLNMLDFMGSHTNCCSLDEEDAQRMLTQFKCVKKNGENSATLDVVGEMVDYFSQLYTLQKRYDRDFSKTM